MPRHCPHDLIQRCPLYHAAHLAIGIGCVPEGAEGDMSCARRKAFRETELRRLAAARPGFVEQLRFRHDAIDAGLITVSDTLLDALAATPDPCLSLSRINEPGTVRTGNTGGDDEST